MQSLPGVVGLSHPDESGWAPATFHVEVRNKECSGPLHEEGRFVGARSPTGGDGDIEHAEVDAELAAVLVPVVQHNIAQELHSWLYGEFPFACHQAPGFVHGCVVVAGEEFAYRNDAFVEGFQDFGTALRLGELEFGGYLGGIVCDEARHPTGDESEMKGELASCHRFGVRLPGEFVFGQTLEEAPSDGRLGFELGEQGLSDGRGNGFCNGHGD